MEILFTANYINNTNSNFRICNIPKGVVGGIESSVYCVLNNILLRGCPTIPSKSLMDALGINSFDLSQISEEDKRRLTASIRLQITLIRLLLSGAISLGEDFNLSIKTPGVSEFEQAAFDDLVLWIKNLFVLADIEFNEPNVHINRVSDFKDSGYDDTKIAIELDKTSVDEDEFGVINVISMYEQGIDYSDLEICEPIKYSFSKDLEEKNQALLFVLKNIFGFDEFWPGQEKIIKNALSRRDTIGVLPTGSGKSLCYQMCAVLQPCLTICIAPIKSLMIDQYQNLLEFGVTKVAYISSDLSSEERKIVTENFKNHKYLLTYMAPERFQSQEFRESLSTMRNIDGCKYSHVVIDEVHCMSEWGHSFRTSYLNLVKTCKKYCGDTVLFGLTATASENVLRNIKIEFGMKDDENVISVPSFTRKELEFKVVNVKSESNKYNELNKLLEQYMYYHNDLLEPNGKASKCGIIFTPFASNKHPYGCAKLARDLKQKYSCDIRCFAGEKPKGWEDEEPWDEYKKNAQNDFKDNKYTTIVATKAFGTGIDKKNIRYTIHYGLPSSLEALYQEAGRAGRDKNPAQCVVIYNSESKADMKDFARVLTPDSTVEELKQVVENLGYNGQDLARQVFLFSTNSITYSDEIRCATYITNKIKKGETCIGEYHDPNRKLFFSREMLEKVVYHLSVIGVIDDWTVDCAKKQINVIPVKDYSLEDVCGKVNTYIKNYNREDGIDLNDDFFKRNKENFAGKEEILILALYYKWYHEKIIGYRKQSLINIVEACEAFDKSGPAEFKNTIESYFRLSDITLMIGQIADNPLEYNNWFELFALASEQKTSDKELSINMGRFLESFQNNVAIDFLSGMANLFAGTFESLNGRQRLERAMTVINTLDLSDRLDILEKSIVLLEKRESNQLNEQFSEFMMNKLDVNDLDEILYNRLEDKYSLSVYMKKVMSRLATFAGE